MTPHSSRRTERRRCGPYTPALPQVTLDRPILITGTPRSGKTVVRRIMAAADEFVCVEEPLMIWSAGMGVRSDDRRTAEDASPEVCERIRRAKQRPTVNPGEIGTTSRSRV